MRKREVLSLASRRFLGIDFPRGRDLGPVLVVWLLSLMVLVFEKDLGTSLLYFGMFVVTLYIATERVSWLHHRPAAVLRRRRSWPGRWARSSAGRSPTSPSRVDVWLHPFADADDTGLPAGAVAARARHRRAVRRRARQRLPYLPSSSATSCPRSHNDFIFAGIGEEIGLFGLTALLVAYLLIVERGLRTAVTVRDSFGKLLAGGLAFTLGLQVFVIVGGVTGLIPLTGQTTPFLSAGGSSLMANWLLLALLLRISDAARRPADASAGRRLASPPPPPSCTRPRRRSIAMNAPLRKAGVVMMVLFGLLFAQPQLGAGGQGRRVPHRRRAQPDPGAAAGVRAPARQDHRRRRGGRARASRPRTR